MRIIRVEGVRTREHLGAIVESVTIRVAIERVRTRVL